MHNIRQQWNAFIISKSRAYKTYYFDSLHWMPFDIHASFLSFFCHMSHQNTYCQYLMFKWHDVPTFIGIVISRIFDQVDDVKWRRIFEIWRQTVHDPVGNWKSVANVTYEHGSTWSLCTMNKVSEATAIIIFLLFATKPTEIQRQHLFESHIKTKMKLWHIFEVTGLPKLLSI